MIVAMLALVAAHLISSGCTQQPPTQASAPTRTEARVVDPTLVKLYPDTTNAGQAFNLQAGGVSGLATKVALSRASVRLTMRFGTCDCQDEEGL